MVIWYNLDDFGVVMSLFEIVLIGAGLSMDAFAVTISNTMGHTDLSRARLLSMPAAFGAFQGIMPFLGYFLGSFFREILEKYQGIVAFLILGVIGAKMIIDSIREKDEKTEDTLSITVLLAQAVATSIDAFAVGVGFAGTNINIISASSLIALTTFILILIAIPAGQKLGEILGKRAKIIGGIVLIAIGIKSLIG